MYSPLALTLTRRLPVQRAWLTNTLLVVAGSLLVALLAQVSVPLPFTPVPLTGQTLSVLLVGAALGAKRGAASLTLYTLEGAVGLPVFAGGEAGLAKLFGLTGGYLLGFIAAAGVVGYLAERGLDRRVRTALLPFLAGSVTIYVFGVIGLAFYLGLPGAITAGLLPFLLGDAIKLALAALALPSAWALVKAFDRP